MAIPLRSATTLQGRLMAGARSLWRAGAAVRSLRPENWKK